MSGGRKKSIVVDISLNSEDKELIDENERGEYE